MGAGTHIDFHAKDHAPDGLVRIGQVLVVFSPLDLLHNPRTKHEAERLSIESTFGTMVTQMYSDILHNA